MSCVWMLQRGHSGDGCVLASTLCKYDLRMGDLFVLSWARVRRVRRGRISSELLVCGGGVRSILLLPLVARCLETILELRHPHHREAYFTVHSTVHTTCSHYTASHTRHSHRNSSYNAPVEPVCSTSHEHSHDPCQVGAQTPYYILPIPQSI